MHVSLLFHAYVKNEKVNLYIFLIFLQNILRFARHREIAYLSDSVNRWWKLPGNVRCPGQIRIFSFKRFAREGGVPII